MKQVRVRKMVLLILALTMLLPLLAACTKQEDTVKPGAERVLRIGIMQGSTDDSGFRQQYVNAFELANPNVRIEIVPAINNEDNRYEDYDSQSKVPIAKDAWKKIMDGANPVDVVVTDTHSFQQLAADGKFARLDERIVQDKFDTSDLVPAVQDGIKAMGNGSIYGLAPTFNSSALIYNKKLFQDAGVEFPKDGMTWDEVFILAQRVSKGEGKERIYGLMFENYVGDAYASLKSVYLPALPLQMIDSKAEKMYVNSDKWTQVWNETSKLYKDKLIPGPDYWADSQQSQQDWGPLSYDLFLSGKTAMSITDMHYLNNDVASAMRNASKIKNFKPFEWGVVTIPYHTEAPHVSGLIKINTIFSINAKASNAEDAWDFIQYVNGEKWAKVQSRGANNEIVTRKSYIKPAGGMNYNIEAFYSGTPVISTSNNLVDLFNAKPDLYVVDYLGNELFAEVLAGKKSTKDALAEWEVKGNEMLQKIKNGIPLQPQEGPGH